MDLIALGEHDYRKGTETQFLQKVNSDWRKWEDFCRETWIKDKFLKEYSKEERIQLLCAFAASVRRNFFGKTNKKVLHGDTVQNTIRHIRQIFRTNGFSDPGSDDSGRTNLKLTRIFNGYKKSDPNTSNQCALPLNVFRLLAFNNLSIKNKHIGLLAVGALFFGMRSCEYLRVKNQDQKQTKLLTLENFHFFKSNRRLDTHSPDITKADYLSITFVSQKNGEKNQTVIQHRSKRSLCPVKAWGSLILLILAYENTNLSTTINYFESDKKPNYITSEDMINQIRSACQSLGEDKLGFTPEKAGTHSIRSSFAMQLFLAGVKDHIIMLQGRWKSLSFLNYIRPQVQELSKDLSSQMVSLATSYFNVSKTRKNIVRTESLSKQKNIHS